MTLSNLCENLPQKKKIPTKNRDSMIFLSFMVPPARIELATSPLPRAGNKHILDSLSILNIL